MAEILKYVQKRSKFLTRFEKCSSRRIEDSRRTGQTQLATNEPLLLLMSFSCATQEMREILKALIQTILGVKTLGLILAQSCHLISVRRIEMDLPRPVLHSSTIPVAPKSY